MIISKALGWSFLMVGVYFAALPGVAQTLDDPAVRQSRDNLNRGVKAFTEQRYEEAAQFFDKAVQLDPDFETARMYLATAYTSQFVPGSTDPKSVEMAQKGIGTFKGVVENAKGPANANKKLAMLSIASLYYQLREYSESKEWCNKLLEIDPQNAEAYYRIGVIDFDDSLERTGVQGELVELMAPDEIAKTQAVIDEGLQCLGKAIEIHPNYFDAMEYQNLLWREKAKLEKDEKAKAELTREADKVAQKALALRLKEQEEAGRYIPIPTPPPPKPVKRDPVKVGSNVQESKLIRRVEPVYPELAKRARVEARVLLVVTIDEEGNVSEIRVIAGHPLLVEAALNAVRQWKYSPTLLNGVAVPVITTVTVRFSLAASGETVVPVGDGRLSKANALFLTLRLPGSALHRSTFLAGPIPIEICPFLGTAFAGKIPGVASQKEFSVNGNTSLDLGSPHPAHVASYQLIGRPHWGQRQRSSSFLTHS